MAQGKICLSWTLTPMLTHAADHQRLSCMPTVKTHGVWLAQVDMEEKREQWEAAERVIQSYSSLRSHEWDKIMRQDDLIQEMRVREMSHTCHNMRHDPCDTMFQRSTDLPMQNNNDDPANVLLTPRSTRSPGQTGRRPTASLCLRSWTGR